MNVLAGSPGPPQDAEDEGNIEAQLPEQMSRVLDLLAEKNPQLDYLQIAQDGDWMQGVKLLPDQDINAGSVNNITSTNTAVEAFFRLADGSHAFIGFKYPEPFPKTPAEFAQALAATLSSNKEKPVKDLLQAAGSAIWGDSDAYTAREPETSVAMVVDYWTQLPVETIWKQGDPAPVSTTLKDMLSNTPELVSNNVNPICLEIDFGAPGLWIGLPVSVQEGQSHTLDNSKLDEALSVLQS